jgi:hypothetical protein
MYPPKTRAAKSSLMVFQSVTMGYTFLMGEKDAILCFLVKVKARTGQLNCFAAIDQSSLNFVFSL